MVFDELLSKGVYACVEWINDQLKLSEGKNDGKYVGI